MSSFSKNLNVEYTFCFLFSCNIIIWNISQGFNRSISPLFDKWKTALLERGPKDAWNNSKKKRNNPKIIFDIEGPVHLVSKTQMQEYLPSHMLFKLSHRAGTTIRLLQEIEDMLDNGLAILKVETNYPEAIRNSSKSVGSIDVTFK